jgi:tRNA A-37 threonylcarbamoyl transferase component Bud32
MDSSTARTHHDRPLFAAGLDTSSGAELVQARLALLAKTICLLSLMFYAIGNGILFVSTNLPPASYLAGPVAVPQAVGTGVMALVWLLMRRRAWSLGALGLIDALALPLSCTAWTTMGAHNFHEAHSTLLAIMVTTVARAILVPSTAERTFWLTTIASVPMVVLALRYELPPPPPEVAVIEGGFRMIFVFQVSLWLAAQVAVATVASRTIYGLRRQVSEATDIGQYTLEAKIGAGGMGEVWRARHRLLIRPAAVKLIRPQTLGAAAGDPELLMRRFEREARATAALKSPHTVQLHDFGVADDGTLYYVMELLDGLDLDTLVKRFGPVPAERAVHILEQVCASLADAHANGLVHRDVKPANIVVCRVAAAWDFVKVLDFGLVKLEGVNASHGEESVKLTAAGAVSGTPAFMSPEMALGEQEVDHRVDIYSLGCVGYWLLTGKLVFEGPTAMKVMFAHAHTPPPPPSSRVELPIPAALETLILECLEKEPARRPASAVAVQTRLAALAKTMPWAPESAEHWWAVHAPTQSGARPAADILLSQEARPLRLQRRVGG